MAEDRSSREELVQRERAVEDIASDQSELALEIERRQCVPGDDARGKIGRVTIDGGDHQRFDFLFHRVPRCAVRQFRVRVLAKEARDMLAVRRERCVDQRWNEHLDDGLARPSGQARVEIGALHVGKRWRHDDA